MAGELLRNDPPKRSFRQLFLLAPQSVHKFYIKKEMLYFEDDIFSFEDARRLFNISTAMVHPPHNTSEALCHSPKASISRSVALENSLSLLNKFLVPLLNNAIRQPANLKIHSQEEGISSTLPVTFNQDPALVQRLQHIDNNQVRMIKGKNANNQKNVKLPIGKGKEINTKKVGKVHNDVKPSVADKEEALKMKNEGNKLFMKEQFSEALVMYTLSLIHI